MNGPTDLTLRPAAPADEMTIHRLVREAQINPLGIHWERFVVIESPQRTVVACGQIKRHSDGTHELASLVVDPAWRGQGLARRIIEHLIAHHAGPLFLMCESSLEPLYEKFGFVRLADADLPRYFRRMKFLMQLPEKLGGFSISIMQLSGHDR